MEMGTLVSGVFKLADYAASGIGSVAGPMLASWKARREANAKLIAAKGEVEAQRILAEGKAHAMQITAAAQAEVRALLVSPDADVQGQLDFGASVTQRIQFQEEKRQSNIVTVINQAAQELGGKEVQDHEVDHDWTARFFNEVQDVSSEEMQQLWAKILAGEVERPGSTSVKTLGILKNLDKETAWIFQRACSVCVAYGWGNHGPIDARIPSLGEPGPRGLPPLPNSNSLRDYGLGYAALHALNEHGLIVPDYNSWIDYNFSISAWRTEYEEGMTVTPFQFQEKNWVLVPTVKRNATEQLKLSGVALTQSGREMFSVAAEEPNDEFRRALIGWFETQGLQLTEVEGQHSRPANLFSDHHENT